MHATLERKSTGMALGGDTLNTAKRFTSHPQ